MKVSRTEAESIQGVAEPGVALVRIGNAEYKVASTGNPGVTLTLEILASLNVKDEGNLIRFQTIYLRDKDGRDDTRKLSQLLLAVLPETFANEDDPDIDPSDRDFLSDLINRHMVVCFVKGNDNKGRLRNDITPFGPNYRFYYPEEEYEALAGTKGTDSSDDSF